MQRTYHFAEQSPTRAEGAVFEKLVRIGRKQHFESGVQVLHRGDPSTGFWLIKSGYLMACRFGQEGERTLFAILGSGDLVGEVSCFAGLDQHINAVTEGDTELVWIAMADVDKLLAKEPQFARWLLNAMASKLRTALDRVEGDQSHSAKARISRVLADIATNEGREIAMTQQDLADLVGASRVTVGQILSSLAKNGLISLGYRKINVVDPIALASHARKTSGC